MLLHSILLSVISFFSALFLYPLVLSIALKHNIVDNPDFRKLQRKPVPVLGGVVVLLGFMISIIVGIVVFKITVSWYFILACIIMTAVGCWDDIKDISPFIRLILEVLVIIGFIVFDSGIIDSLHGFLGVYDIPKWIAISLTIIAGVGIMNAINLIDGVDGYSSGYCMVSSILFSFLFFKVGETTLALTALILAAALLPFFLHNVFGYWSKMYIGDSGTLLMGTIMSFFVLKTLTSGSPFYELNSSGFSIIAFCLAVLAVPVFDTLRVMIRRIMRKRSPFSPDKTHLHHAFIELGFSHIGTSFSIISLNLCVVLVFIVTYKIGLSISVQIIAVILGGLLITLALYSFMKTQKYYNTKACESMERLGEMTHKERTGFWLYMRKLMDGKKYKEGPDEYYDLHPLDKAENK